jgi:D-alanyl-D-alanine dipeptidase
MLLPIRAGCDAILDLRYATAENLTGRPIYRRPVALLAAPALAALRRAAGQAAKLGLRLKIFDAFRPIEAQWALWRALPDARFVADPRHGGTHPRGVAVDLTLCDAVTGNELPMGTGFDAMTAASAHDAEATPDVARNRLLLLGLMTAAGWTHHQPEWWHYQLPDAFAYPPLAARAAPMGPM